MTTFFVAGHALINRDGKFLVLRRSENNDYKPLFWDLPGGVVIAGETLAQTISREVKEETNIDIEVEKVLYVYSNIDQIPVRQTIQLVYSCKYVRGNVRINPEEHDNYKWASYSELSSLNSIDFLSNLVQEYRQPI